MANFEVLIETVESVEHHPNADRLSLIKIRGYKAISAKLDDGSHRYNKGDLVVYIPCGSIVPDYLLKQGFWDENRNRGILSDSNYNRVKEIRLRGIFSEGIIFPVIENKISNESETIEVSSGQNVTEFLGITKYEPQIPACFGGDVYCETSLVKRYEVENIKKFPNAFHENELVVMTEKLHGTSFRIIIHPDFYIEDAFCGGYVSIASKGLGNQGIFFKNNNVNRKNGNIYVKTFLRIEDKIQKIYNNSKNIHGNKHIIFGEIYGKGVQDLAYDCNDIEFRVFDVYNNVLGYLDYKDMCYFCESNCLQTVPLIYEGEYSENALKNATDGKSNLANHIREGVVIKPCIERQDINGRVLYKSVSEDYLTRKGNTSEYQ